MKSSFITSFVTRTSQLLLILINVEIFSLDSIARVDNMCKVNRPATYSSRQNRKEKEKYVSVYLLTAIVRSVQINTITQYPFIILYQEEKKKIHQTFSSFCITSFACFFSMPSTKDMDLSVKYQRNSCLFK